MSANNTIILIPLFWLILQPATSARENMFPAFDPTCDITGGPSSGPTVNVRDFGAAGDGQADDALPIRSAIDKIREAAGGRLYVPRGVYRIGRQEEGEAGIALIKMSNVTVHFEPGAILLMDTLNDQRIGVKNISGVYVNGPARNIRLINVHVRWKERPEKRSAGDGFCFEGYPDDSQTIANIQLVNCLAELCPQAGAVLMGCSDIDVQNFQAINTLADGLHFNACRNVNVNGVRGLNNGDDSLAFVNYCDTEGQKVRQHYKKGPFALADLGEWSSFGSVVTNVIAWGGRANGVRLAGANNVTLQNINVTEKSCGIVADCGEKDGNRFSWSYYASRDIVISNLVATRCNTGFFVWNFNQPFTGDNRFYEFSIVANNLIARDCGNDSLHLWNCAGVSVNNLRAHKQRVRLNNVKDCTVNGADVYDSYFLLSRPSGDSLSSGIYLDGIRVTGGYIGIEHARDSKFGSLVCRQAKENGVFLNDVENCQLDAIVVNNPNRGGSARAKGLLIKNSSAVMIGAYALAIDDNPSGILEISLNKGQNNVAIQNSLCLVNRKEADRDITIKCEDGEQSCVQGNLTVNYSTEGGPVKKVFALSEN